MATTARPPMNSMIEERIIPPDVLERIAAEQASKHERGIDYVRRYCALVVARKAALNKEQIIAAVPGVRDFSVRYWRLFDMMYDPRFEPGHLAEILRRWEATTGGGELEIEASKKDARFQAASNNWANAMTKKYVEPILPATRQSAAHTTPAAV